MGWKNVWGTSPASGVDFFHSPFQKCASQTKPKNQWKIWIFLPSNCFRNLIVIWEGFYVYFHIYLIWQLKRCFLLPFPNLPFQMFSDFVFILWSSVWGKIIFICIWYGLLGKELLAKYSSQKIIEMLQKCVKSREWWQGSTAWTLKVQPFFHKMEKKWKMWILER